MQELYYVVVFVLRPAGHSYELLMGRRAEGSYMGGTWQLISGRIEDDGETAWQAALREVREESGLAVRELYRLPTLARFYRSDVDAVCTGIPFAGIVDRDATPAINPEHTDLKWVSIDAAGELLMWPDDRTALSHVRSEILADGPAKPYLRISVP